ncbi:MAG: serine/threonine protein kinase [Alphaproteobacteria bacterium]|nr:serine/threonine protein kinase [Brevundimonas sp.]MBU3971951.1 serine/threonine protein kinase [Alphaproteobacteria bacterium]MBU3973975.1 serine/threonine protein kinase [Alphaproteobacteria bacterium]MBU4039993.1 serine/threonine protein kinase [Alphaproteobacteria bacterium]MBU4136561.1 serine/threonine protein kinase [Alphaproteobacteria bacterium]
MPGGGLGLYAVYALILFAVPTVGVSAAIGLFAVTGRAGPDDDLSSSHFIYQQRTLWAAAVAAVAGVILLAAPFALGVPILFLLALWMVLRGASGVWALKSGRAIADPLGWWI